MDKMIYDVIIIGSGPAGMSSAIYARRANLKTLLIEKSAPGGKLLQISKLKNYPGFIKDDGVMLATDMYEQVTNLNPDFEYDEVVDIELSDEIKVVRTNKKEFYCKNIIVATGTSYENLRVAKENRYIGKGISYCAVCDGKFYEGKDIVVLACNEHGFEETLYLNSFANKIYLITDDNFDNSKYKDDIQKENIVVLKGVKITELIGEQSLSGVKLNDGTSLNISGIFPLNNNLPVNTFLRKYDIFSSNGYVKVDQNMETRIKGLFAIGDVNNHDLKQVVTACNDGAIAAQTILKRKIAR